MTENHERAEQARFVFHIYGCNVQIVPNATHAIQIIHQGDGTILRTESCITPAASGRHESQAPPLGKVRALMIIQGLIRLIIRTFQVQSICSEELP